jgi:hypothetical protein
MKKIFTLFVFTICLTFATKAQTTQSGGQTQTNVQSATELSGQVPDAKPNEDKSVSEAKSTVGKSCCSSKEMKESGKKGEKSCCADGKKNDVNCSDKNKKAEMHDHHENMTDEKSNNK